MWSPFSFFSPFQKLNVHSTQQQPLLNELELQECYAMAGKIDGSGASSQILHSQQSGRMPTQPLGSGMDYAESRVYQEGDDTKSINWRLSARSQETFVKTFHMESRPRCCILLDRRESMIFGTRSRLKISQAVRLAIMLAYAAELHQLTLDALILEEGITHQDNQNTATFIMQANTPCMLKSCESADKLATAFYEIQQLPQGSLIYLISDFADLDESDQAALVQLKASYFVQAVHIMDKAELELPNMGEVRLRGRGVEQEFVLKSQQEKQREAFATYAAAQADKKKALLTDLGVNYVRVFTGADDIHQHMIMPYASSTMD